MALVADRFFTWNVVTMALPSRLADWMKPSSAVPRSGGADFLSTGAGVVWAWAWSITVAGTSRAAVAARASTVRTRIFDSLKNVETDALYRYISPFQSSGSGVTDRMISRCH